MNQVLWSANFCYLASLWKGQWRRVFLWCQSQKDLHLFCQFEMTCTWTRKVEKSSHHDWDFLVIVSNELRRGHYWMMTNKHDRKRRVSSSVVRTTFGDAPLFPSCIFVAHRIVLHAKVVKIVRFGNLIKDLHPLNVLLLFQVQLTPLRQVPTQNNPNSPWLLSSLYQSSVLLVWSSLSSSLSSSSIYSVVVAAITLVTKQQQRTTLMLPLRSFLTMLLITSSEPLESWTLS